MKTIFIVNPEAGKGKCKEAFTEAINSSISKIKADAEVYITKCVGDAERFVKNYCKNNGYARFIACGGDGTLNEVLNGVIYSQDSQVGVIPMGTGNDFCRNFDSKYNFNDIKNQILGKCVKCDAIRYRTVRNNVTKEGYCANMFNIGFDCNVADLTASIKKKPFIAGSFAYFASILLTLIKKKGANLRIEMDNKVVHDGKLLLTSLANGCYCGGGVRSNPLASIKDGLININIIRNVTRSKLITLLPHYMKGTALKLKGIDKYITSEKCQKITITPLEGNMRLCIDGEIVDAGKTEFEIIPEAFNFVIPDVNLTLDKTEIDKIYV